MSFGARPHFTRLAFFPCRVPAFSAVSIAITAVELSAQSSTARSVPTVRLSWMRHPMQSKLTNLRVTQIYQTRLVVIWGDFKEMQCRQNNVEKELTAANGGKLDYKEE